MECWLWTNRRPIWVSSDTSSSLFDIVYCGSSRCHPRNRNRLTFSLETIINTEQQRHTYMVTTFRPREQVRPGQGAGPNHRSTFGAIELSISCHYSRRGLYHYDETGACRLSWILDAGAIFSGHQRGRSRWSILLQNQGSELG